MADQDPAITHAKALLKARRTQEAFSVLAQRIIVLRAENLSLQQMLNHREPDHSHSPRNLSLYLLALVLILLVGGGLLWQAGVLQIGKARHDPAVQEWWSYNASLADEFMSSLRLAVIMSVGDSTINDNYEAYFLDYILEASNYQDRFEAAQYPFKAKEIRDNIIQGMTEYQLFAFGVQDDMPLFLETGEFSPETLQYLEEARAHMRNAARQIKDLTGEDASFLIMENTEE